MQRSKAGNAGLLPTSALEPVKWLALVLMFVEHFYRRVLNTFPEHVFYLGRQVLPLFALALAVGIARKSEEGRYELVFRMLIWGVVAAIAGLTIRDAFPLNALFTLAAGVALHTLYTGHAQGRWIYIAGVLVAAPSVEYGALGVAGVALYAEFGRRQTSPQGIVSVLLGTVCFCAANGGSLAPALALPIAVCIGLSGVNVPRIKRVFYWTYAGQWPVLAGLRALA